jgi:DNA-binding CsgD family transcriptional regulator
MVDQWPLTGRGEELRVVSESLSGNEQNGIVLAGPAGVGKTRLARAAAEAASRSGWSVRRVAGTATGRPVTLGAFARWADDSDPSPAALARNVVAGLTAGTDGAPLLVFVDDAHLLDDLSALVVHQMVLQDVASVIVTIRTGEPAPDAVTALWKDDLLRRLELQPLSRNESDDLLRAVLDGPVAGSCGDRMWQLSHGNVLFLHHLVEHERGSGRLARISGEWCWAGSPSVSPSLVELVEHQIGAVPNDIQEVVDLVAIAEPIDRELLAVLTDPQSIEAAEERGLITATSTTDDVCVGHPLYGEIRLSQCGPLRLNRLRGRVATAMAQTEAADPLRLGLLWMESDLPPDAEILTRAAKISASRTDFRNAERLAQAAVDANASAETKLALARILLLHDKGEAAEKILNTIESEEVADVGFFDEAILRAANLLWPLAKPDEARTVIDDAIAVAGGGVRGHALRTMRAVIEVNAAKPAEVIQTMATVNYELLDDFGRVAGYTSETLALGDLGRAAEATGSATAAYRVLDESPEQDAFHGTGLGEFHVYALAGAGYVDKAFSVAEREYQRRADFPGQSRWMAIASLGMAAIAKGDLVAALRWLSSASTGLGDHDEISGLLYRFRIPYTEALARSGDIDAAVASLEIARGNHHPSFKFVEAGWLLVNAWVAAVAGRVSEAREISRRAVEFARSHGQLSREVLSLQTAVQFGDVAGADRLAELANQVEGPRAPLAARYARALAADDAVGLDAVSRDFEAMGDVLAAADASAQAAASHRLAGRKGSALTASARAQLLAKECGGAVSPALITAQVPLPFTRREHEVANLVSRGLTNKEIAEATTLSVRTVEGHIYQASAKAGVSSRSELATLVQQFNELGDPSN